MGQTFVEKVFSKKMGARVVPGQIVEVEPDVAMSHDNTAAISGIFKKIGVDKLARPDIHVVILDHAAPAPNEIIAANHKTVREFVKQFGIKRFHDINTGICHQVMCEKGYVLPGMVAVGSDSHSTTYGAMGAFGTGIGRSEMAVVFATGRLWFRVPETIHVHLDGSMPRGITSKDLMLKIAKKLGVDGAIYKMIEFAGPLIGKLSIAQRMIFPNMAVEIGAKAGFVEPDDKMVAWLKERTDVPFEVIRPDADAEYEAKFSFDCSTLEPQVATPHDVDQVFDVSEVKGVKIDQLMLGTCCNGRLEDFEVTAKILKGRKVSPNVRFLAFPASMDIYLEALKRGYVQTLMEAGVIMMNPGCGPCMGAHEGILAPGEVALTTSNRNFKGRMGCKEADVYLGSPATVAASAITGYITDHRELGWLDEEN
jgi:3-isopropylmalate/(R)-2-methylmalate dehydratase large subunit